MPRAQQATLAQTAASSHSFGESQRGLVTKVVTAIAAQAMLMKAVVVKPEARRRRARWLWWRRDILGGGYVEGGAGLGTQVLSGLWLTAAAFPHLIHRSLREGLGAAVSHRWRERWGWWHSTRALPPAVEELEAQAGQCLRSNAERERHAREGVAHVGRGRKGHSLSRQCEGVRAQSDAEDGQNDGHRKSQAHVCTRWRCRDSPEPQEWSAYERLCERHRRGDEGGAHEHEDEGVQTH